MNILIDQLPDYVEVDGVQYKIDPDFRTVIRTLVAFEDNDLTQNEKHYVLVTNHVKDKVPLEILPKVAEEILKFFNMYEEFESDGNRYYSFSKDAKLIYAAFRQTHGIDLTTVNLHWFQFMSLLMDAGADTVFCSIVSLRKRVKTGKATKEERKLAREMKDIFDLPEVDNRTVEEKEAERKFMEMVERATSGR